jgi:hypothetical protein
MFVPRMKLDATGLHRGGSRFSLHEATLSCPPSCSRTSRGGAAAGGAGVTRWRAACSEKPNDPLGKPAGFVTNKENNRGNDFVVAATTVIL